MVWALREDGTFPEGAVDTGRSSGCGEQPELGKHPHTWHVWGPVACGPNTDTGSQAALETPLGSLSFVLLAVGETLVPLQQVNGMVTFVLPWFFES